VSLRGRISNLGAPPRGPWWKAQLDSGENVYLREEAVEYLRRIQEHLDRDPGLYFVAEDKGLAEGQVVWFVRPINSVMRSRKASCLERYSDTSEPRVTDGPPVESRE
jgi:hypothetical protein